MNKNNIIKSLLVVITVLLVIIIFMRECKRCPEVSQQTSLGADTTYIYEYGDTIEVISNYYIPGPKETIYITIPQDVDTPGILATHFSKVYYADVMLDDSNAYIFVEDTLYKNSIISRNYVYKDKTPTHITQQIITYDTCKECKTFNIGFGGIIGGYTDKFGAGPSIMLTTNKKGSYTASYDAINKIGYLGIYWNIK